MFIILFLFDLTCLYIKLLSLMKIVKENKYMEDQILVLGLSGIFYYFALVDCFSLPEMVVGWYHSHPGFGCWLSGVDINTQQVCFEALNRRAVHCVVIDPIQSVKGKVVIDAFDQSSNHDVGTRATTTTSNVGYLNKPSIQALIHGLNRHYYSIAINYRKNELEEKMLLNLHKKKWTDGLPLQQFDSHSKTNEQTEMRSLATKYNKAVQEEDELSPEKFAIANVGRQDAKKHLEGHMNNYTGQ
ncbi:hypothetical protein MKW92_025748 [Papaver armeniacum]|nr:hypothetical protein MKW92_025748 [Papaver armeniacum]